jgi:hypothetical protein
MSTIELLTKLGLPSAIIGIVLIAITFRRTHLKISAAAAAMAVFLVFLLGVVQLVHTVTDGDITIALAPADAHVLTANGPASLKIAVVRGDDSVRTSTIARMSDESFERVLLDLGFRRAEKLEPPRGTLPRYWSTNRVYAGQTYRVGETEYGLLQLRATQFTESGDAFVTLELVGRGRPIPEHLEIKNKQLDAQTFAGLPEFWVAVREADFTGKRPWAAFSIFTR